MLEVELHIHAPVVEEMLWLGFPTLLFENLEGKRKSINCFLEEFKTPITWHLIDRSNLDTKIIKSIDIGGVDYHVLKIGYECLSVELLEFNTPEQRVQEDIWYMFQRLRQSIVIFQECVEIIAMMFWTLTLQNLDGYFTAE